MMMMMTGCMRLLRSETAAKCCGCVGSIRHPFSSTQVESGLERVEWLRLRPQQRDRDELKRRFHSFPFNSFFFSFTFLLCRLERNGMEWKMQFLIFFHSFFLSRFLLLLSLREWANVSILWVRFLDAFNFLAVRPNQKHTFIRWEKVDYFTFERSANGKINANIYLSSCDLESSC